MSLFALSRNKFLIFFMQGGINRVRNSTIPNLLYLLEAYRLPVISVRTILVLGYVARLPIDFRCGVIQCPINGYPSVWHTGGSEQLLRTLNWHDVALPILNALLPVEVVTNGQSHCVEEAILGSQLHTQLCPK